MGTKRRRGGGRGRGEGGSRAGTHGPANHEPAGTPTTPHAPRTPVKTRRSTGRRGAYQHPTQTTGTILNVLAAHAAKFGLAQTTAIDLIMKLPADAANREWLLRDKWIGFYDGTFAPHLPAGSAGSIDELPWRSGTPSSQLVNYLSKCDEKALREGAAIELGCGTGENLVFLAGAFRRAVGVDISPEAVHVAEMAVAAAGSSAQTLVADVLALPCELHEAFDLVFDCQTFHCVRKVDEAAAAAAMVSLLKPDGVLLLITGNADEAEERGPERLTRADLDRAFATRGLVCEACEPFRFDWTAAYRRQPFPKPPLGWCSVWRRPRPSTQQDKAGVATASGSKALKVPEL